MMESELFLPRLYDPFICPICLDTITEPVTIPCGHSFCMACIRKTWDNLDRGKKSVSCPLCLEKFSIRPQLRKSQLLSELLERSQTGGQQAAPEPASSPEDILCDFCTEEQTKAARSCLVCLASYCEPHLKPHLKNPVFQSHRLVPPVRHMEEKLCKVHLKLLEGFCRTDQMCVCYLCSAQDHAEHEVVTLEQERVEKESQRLPVLRRVEMQLQEMEANSIKLSKTVEFIKSTAVTEKADVKSLIAEATTALGKLEEDVTGFIDSEEISSLSLAEESQVQLRERFQKLSQQRERLEDVQGMDTVSFIQELQALKKVSGDGSFRSLNFEKELKFTKSSQAVRAVKEVLTDMCQNQWDTLSGKDLFQPLLLDVLDSPVHTMKLPSLKYFPSKTVGGARCTDELDVKPKKHFQFEEDDM